MRRTIGTISKVILIRHLRWRLLLGLECTLLGQFMVAMEHAQQAHVNNPPDAGPAKLSTPMWETMLRSVCRGGFFWEDYVPPSHRQSPFHLYSGISDPSESELSTNEERRRIFEIIAITQDSLNDPSASVGRHARQMGSPANIGGISSWNRLQYFACDAFAELHILFRSALFCDGSVMCKCCKCSGDYDTDVLLSSVISSDCDNDVAVGVVFVLLQIMHGMGVLLGCVLRGGVCIADLEFPAYFWSMLVGDEVDKGVIEDAMDGIRRMCVLALQNGLLSVIAQVFIF